MTTQLLSHRSDSKVNMSLQTSSIFFLLTSLVLSHFTPIFCSFEDIEDVNLLEFPLNLEFLEAEFFLYGATGLGLDAVDPSLAQGGPPPVGGKIAYLDPVVKDIILQFAFQEVGHLRAIFKEVKGFPRPLLNISKESFAEVVNSAFGKPLSPPFDPYANSINYLLASYLIPYVGLTGYVGANPKLQKPSSRALVAGLLGVESGQDAVIRALLYERKDSQVTPYEWTVAEFTHRFSLLRNSLGKKDAEGKIVGQVLGGTQYSLSYPRTPEQILRIVYGSGDEHIPGGFLPKGGNGAIAKTYLQPSA